jgi:hypothetical protein
MAAVFFEIVGEFRKADPKAIAALDAQVFHGQSAIDAGLADRVQQFDQVLADIASGKVTPMATSYEKGRAAFEEAAKGDDANAAAAKRALAALDEAPAKGDDDEKDKPDEKAADDSSDKDAADDSSDKDAVDDSSDKDAAADGTGTKASARDLALQALAEVHTLKAEGAKKEITAERAKLLASRPDFAPEMRSLLETSDIKTVRKFCKDLPKGPAPKLEAAAAAATAAGTRGAAQGGTDAIAAAASTNEAAARAHKMDIAMGLAEPTLGCRREGNSLVFGIQHVSAADAKASAGSAK